MMTVESNIIAAMGAAALGALSLIFSTSKTVGQQQRNTESAAHHAAEAALVQERIDMRRGYQERYDSLTTEIETLWKMFREMQEALTACERLHREDAAKIAALERQNATQADQIRSLQRGS